MAPRDTVGGQSFWALLILGVTGSIGRYFYAYVPRAANGRELELSEVRTSLARLGDGQGADQVAGGAHREFHREVRQAVDELVEKAQWQTSFFGRVAALVRGKREIQQLTAELERRGIQQGLASDQITPALDLATRAHRTAMMARHYEDVRGLLGTWRFLHRWLALLMVLLLVVHIVHALLYAHIDFGLGGGS